MLKVFRFPSSPVSGAGERTSWRVLGNITSVLVRHRQLVALRQLFKSIKSQAAYVDEAIRMGVIDQLTSLLKRSDDESVMDAAADVITACSGAIAAPPQVSYFHCVGGGSVAIAEGSLSDGLGVRVWLAAHALARTLMAAPGIVKGRTVAELGAGPGLVGLVASRLGARQVTLTDSEDAVLHCLRASVAATIEGGHGSPQLQQQPCNGASEAEQRNMTSCPQRTPENVNERGASSVGGSDSEWDPEDADSCQDFDDLLSSAASRGSVKAGGTPPTQDDSWQQDTIRVRQLDWRDVVRHEGPKEPRSVNAEPSLTACDCPVLEPDAKFEVILASDVVYETESAAALGVALARHLEAEGHALLCCPVRDQALFDSFLEALRVCGLSATLHPVQPLDSDTAVSGQAQDYEGGFQLMAVQHADAQRYDWPWETALSWQDGSCSAIA